MAVGISTGAIIGIVKLAGKMHYGKCKAMGAKYQKACVAKSLVFPPAGYAIPINRWKDITSADKKFDKWMEIKVDGYEGVLNGLGLDVDLSDNADNIMEKLTSEKNIRQSINIGSNIKGLLDG